MLARHLSIAILAGPDRKPTASGDICRVINGGIRNEKIAHKNENRWEDMVIPDYIPLCTCHINPMEILSCLQLTFRRASLANARQLHKHDECRLILPCVRRKDGLNESCAIQCSLPRRRYFFSSFRPIECVHCNIVQLE